MENLDSNLYSAALAIIERNTMKQLRVEFGLIIFSPCGNVHVVL